MKKVTVRIDDYGVTHCENCGAAINWKDIEEPEK